MTAIGSYLVVYVITLLLIMIAAVGSVAMGHSRLPSGPLRITDTELADAGSMLGQFGAQLMAMAHFGDLSAEFTMSYF
ncbi:hypothetical protein [Arthrobacter sp. M4]|uniref:hypothetical protein n=1 Tax=Arthrobacter sp. M4 TaxID=218160 RepID=UPI001CDC916E|nr:hypothetical protein [Arthrobacter sp. M4]MCA4133267.1 hypothetical protein [Arthrobacter sp. M4]